MSIGAVSGPTLLTSPNCLSFRPYANGAASSHCRFGIQIGRDVRLRESDLERPLAPATEEQENQEPKPPPHDEVLPSRGPAARTSLFLFTDVQDGVPRADITRGIRRPYDHNVGAWLPLAQIDLHRLVQSVEDAV